MTQREFIEFLNLAEMLKRNTRHCWNVDGRRESVAEHSWRLALMPMLLEEEFPDLDMDKVIRMCILHDLGEAVTGDIPTFLKTEQDENIEDKAIEKVLLSLPEPTQSKFRGLFQEMEAMETGEAKLCKALDNMEAVLAHNEANISTWLPNEYDLQLTYGEKNVAWSPWLIALKEELNQDTRKKIQEA